MKSRLTMIALTTVLLLSGTFALAFFKPELVAYADDMGSTLKLIANRDEPNAQIRFFKSGDESKVHFMVANAFGSDYPRSSMMLIGNNTVENCMAIDNRNRVYIGMKPNGNSSYKLQVGGSVKAASFDTGDIVFNKGSKPVWRMYEDEDGLYVESLTTGRHFRVALEPIKDTPKK
jgi:hypothetical protein